MENSRTGLQRCAEESRSGCRRGGFNCISGSHTTQSELAEPEGHNFEAAAVLPWGNSATDPMDLLRSSSPGLVAQIQAASDCHGLPRDRAWIQHKCLVPPLPLAPLTPSPIPTCLPPINTLPSPHNPRTLWPDKIPFSGAYNSMVQICTSPIPRRGERKCFMGLFTPEMVHVPCTNPNWHSWLLLQCGVLIRKNSIYSRWLQNSVVPMLVSGRPLFEGTLVQLVWVWSALRGWEGEWNDLLCWSLITALFHIPPPNSASPLTYLGRLASSWTLSTKFSGSSKLIGLKTELLYPHYEIYVFKYSCMLIECKWRCMRGWAISLHYTQMYICVTFAFRCCRCSCYCYRGILNSSDYIFLNS